MTFVDHIAVSTLFANGRKSVAGKWPLMLICMVSGAFPDILTFFYYPGSVGFLQHRSYTNSLVLVPAYALLIAAVFWICSRKKGYSFILFAGLSLVNLLLHLALDLITEYGSPLFYPISGKLFSLDIIYSVDLAFLAVSIAIMLTFIKRARIRSVLSQSFVLMCILLYCLTLSTSLVIKSISASQFRQFLTRANKDAHYLLTVPMPLWHWRGIAEDGARYLILNTDTNQSEARQIFNSTSVGNALAENENVKVFLQYARFPAIAYHGDTVSLSNAVYSYKSFKMQLVREADGSFKFAGLSGYDMKSELGF